MELAADDGAVGQLAEADGWPRIQQMGLRTTQDEPRAEILTDGARREGGWSLADNVVELCVIDGVDNVEDIVVRVERRTRGNVIQTVYEA